MGEPIIKELDSFTYSTKCKVQSTFPEWEHSLGTERHIVHKHSLGLSLHTYVLLLFALQGLQVFSSFC